MKLSEYFEQAKGFGVLATTDAGGQVNQAIYAKPHFLDKDDDGTCSFIMSNRLSHDNVKHNPMQRISSSKKARGTSASDYRSRSSRRRPIWKRSRRFVAVVPL